MRHWVREVEPVKLNFKKCGIFLVLACLLGLCACGRDEAQAAATPPAETGPACGTYQDGVRSWMILKPGGKFEFCYNMVMSAYPSGTYEVRDGKIYAASDQVFAGSVYVFETVDEETLRFCKEESDEIDVEDGAVYKLEPLE